MNRRRMVFVVAVTRSAACVAVLLVMAAGGFAQSNDAGMPRFENAHVERRAMTVPIAAEVKKWTDLGFAGFRAEGFEPNEPVATTPVTLDGRETIIRSQPTRLTALIADAMRHEAKTDLSIFFIGESGVPFEYVYGNDMNGDNGSANDLVYVPKDAHDPTEIQFSQNGNLTPAMQADSLEKFIVSHECLNSQRGTIMTRNSCRTPWTKLVNFSARQSIPTLSGHNVILQLDVFSRGQDDDD